MKRKCKAIVRAILVLITFLVILQVGFCLIADAQTNDAQQPNPNTPTDLSQSNDTINVGLWLINIFGYQYTTGYYTADMYLYFFWTNPNVTSVDWQFANGYPVTPTSVTLLTDNTNGTIKSQVYRATANLNSPPDASDFPFDKINVTISVNVFPHGNNLTLSWLENQSGIDSNFHNPGWKTTSYRFEHSINNYPLGVQVPKATMVVTQERQRPTQSTTPFIPPIFFAIVSAVSFLFSLKEMAAVGLRIGLNTSMLVTTLLFSFGVSNSIPPASSMVLYTIFLLSVLLFMVCNLIVTIIGVVGWMKYKDERRTRIANKLGLIISIVVPAAAFTLLFLLK
jgi:hypothetical protein